MATAVDEHGGATSVPVSTASGTSRRGGSSDYVSYRKMLDGFVTGLDVMLSDWSTQNTDAEAPSSTTTTTTTGKSNGDSKPSIFQDFVQAGMAVGGDSGQDSGSDEDVVDGPEEEDYNTPSISEAYNFHSLSRSAELETVERLHASSDLWFYPTLSRPDALHMLDHKEVGVFMVRNSSKPGNFALSMRQKNPEPYVQHYLIQQTLEGLQVQGAEHLFDSLEELIAHYCDYISGGMPTNLILPQCVAEPDSRGQLLETMRKESEFLKRLEMSVLAPASLTNLQQTCLQEMFVAVKQDPTRVCPPTSYFRRCVKMPVIQTQFDPTPKTPLVSMSDAMAVRGPVAILPPDPDLDPPPPALPPKRARSRTASAKRPHAMIPMTQLSSGAKPRSPETLQSMSHRDVPPPLPPKQNISNSQGPSSNDVNSLSAESPVKRAPPPIPRRGNIPGTLSDEEADEIAEAPKRRHTVSTLDRNRLSLSLSNGGDLTSPKAMSELDRQDSDGYLMPWGDAELAQVILDRRSKASAEVQPRNGTSQGGEHRDEAAHSYISLRAPEEMESPPPASVSPQEQDSEEEGLSANTMSTKAKRVLGLNDSEHRRPSGPRVTPSAWIRNRAARFTRTASQRVGASLAKHAASKNTVLGQNVEAFLIAANSKPHDDNPVRFAEEIRQFMNGLKNYLLGPGRGELIEIVSRSYDLAAGQEVNVQAVLERTLHKVVLKPLKPLIYKSFIEHMRKNGSLGNLQASLKAGKHMTPKEIGIRERLIPPQGPSLHQIGQHLVKMQKAFSPVTKIEHMLAAVQAIYKSVKDTQSELASEQLVMGADDFLPMMVYVLCQLDVWKMEVETEYLWALLDDSLKVGEGGYYLTTISGAVQAIGILAAQKSPEPSPERQRSKTSTNNVPIPTASAASATSHDGGNGTVLSSSSSSSNTSNSAAPAAFTTAAAAALPPPLSLVSPTTGDVRLPCIADMQGFMRIHIDDASGKTVSVHTLPVSPDTTVADTCGMVAKKFAIKEPEKYGLCQVVDGHATLLGDDEKPQMIKAEWLASNLDYGQLHPGVERYFGYRPRSA